MKKDSIFIESFYLLSIASIGFILVILLKDITVIIIDMIIVYINIRIGTNGWVTIPLKIKPLLPKIELFKILIIINQRIIEII